MVPGAAGASVVPAKVAPSGTGATVRMPPASVNGPKAALLRDSA